jgi:hypothetical protein
MHAKTDVCLLRLRSEIILLVQEDKRHLQEKHADAQAQLIAEAIATFQSNNLKRRYTGQPVVEEALIPGIIMIGTSPVFYKIPVTQELSNAVVSGIYPPNPTIVYFHLPPLPRPLRRMSEGMKPLDNRRSVLQCYEAFKRFVFTELV